MTLQLNSQPQAIFPDCPRDAMAVNKDGSFSHGWLIGLQQLFQTLQINYTAQGIMLPPLNATQIQAVSDYYNVTLNVVGKPLPVGVPDITGATIIDITNRVPKVFIITYNGANVSTAGWKTYTVT